MSDEKGTKAPHAIASSSTSVPAHPKETEFKPDPEKAEKLFRTSLALFEAAQTGNVDAVKAIIKLNQDPELSKILNRHNTDTHTALTLAILNGHIEVAKVLHPFMSYHSYEPIILEAAKTGNITALNIIIDTHKGPTLPTLLDARDENTFTSLYLATLGGHTEFVKILMEHGADPTLPDEQGRTPLDLTATYYDIPESKLPMSDLKGSPLFLPLVKKILNGEIAALLLSKGHTNFFPRRIAFRLLKIKILLEAQDENGDTLLHIANRLKNPIVFYLLSNGADPTTRNKKGETVSVDHLIDPDGNTALHFAAINRNTHLIIRLLDDTSLRADTPNKNGWKPIQSIIQIGNRNLIQVLFDYGYFSMEASVERDAENLVHIAVMFNHSHLIPILDDHIATNAQDSNGDTPLHLAIRHERMDCIYELLSLYAIDIFLENKKHHRPIDLLNTPDSKGNTILHKAINTGDVGLIYVLLDLEGIDIHVTNSRGETFIDLLGDAKDLDEEQGNLISKLLSMGAKPTAPSDGKKTTKQTITSLSIDLSAKPATRNSLDLSPPEPPPASAFKTAKVASPSASPPSRIEEEETDGALIESRSLYSSQLCLAQLVTSSASDTEPETESDTDPDARSRLSSRLTSASQTPTRTPRSPDEQKEVEVARPHSTLIRSSATSKLGHWNRTTSISPSTVGYLPPLFPSRKLTTLSASFESFKQPDASPKTQPACSGLLTSFFGKRKESREKPDEEASITQIYPDYDIESQTPPPVDSGSQIDSQTRPPSPPPDDEEDDTCCHCVTM